MAYFKHRQVLYVRKACHVIGAIVYCVSSRPIKEDNRESAVYSSHVVLTLHVIYVSPVRYLAELRVCRPKLNAYSGQIFIFSAHIIFAKIGNVCTRHS